MKIQVRSVNVEIDEKTSADVQRVFQTSFDRFEHRILRIGVRLIDQNGPRGGEDIACRVEVRLRPRGRLFIEATDADLAGAVNRAADKAATAASRMLERNRDLRRRARDSSVLRGARPSFT